MSESKTYLLRVNTDIYALTKVQEWFEQFDQIPHQVWLQCNLVLTEGFTNVVCHAHEHLPEDTPVDIEVAFTDSGLEIRIWDYGKSFDLKQKLEILSQQKYDPTDVDNLPTGGRGLIITNTIADYFNYERTEDGRNCLIIRKNYLD